MKLKIIGFLVGILCGWNGTLAQSLNYLTIPQMEGRLGLELSVPVQMTNENEIVGIQVNIHVPQGLQVNTNAVELSNRKDDHVITVRSQGDGNYLFLILSASNKAIKGSSGTLFTLPVVIPMGWEENAEYSFSFNQVILSSLQGNNLATESYPGAIRIVSEPRPDFTVENIQTGVSNIVPGSSFNASWTVKNVGDQATTSGWSEQISLTDNNGRQSFLGTLYHEGTISAGNQVNRQAEFILPQLPGIDGNMYLSIRIIPDPNSGELPGAQGNNTAKSNQSITVTKKLVLETPSYALPENNASSVQCKLSRSGNWTEQQVFSLTANDPQRISVPASVTIPANQSGVFFYIQIADNTILDADSIVTMVAGGNGYEAATGTVVIEDNEWPALLLTTTQSDLNEGNTFTLTIESERIVSSDLPVYLVCDHAKRFEFPAQVTIPAGQKSLEVSIAAINDNIPDVTANVVFTASAAKHTNGKINLTLNDDDLPEIELILTPQTVNESAGLLAVKAVLRRLTHEDSNITVVLSDNSNGSLYYSSSRITLASGIEEAQFSIGIIDNVNVDGDRAIDITAAVYIPSCGCTASETEAGRVHAQLTILDDDGPALKITSSQTMLPEGMADAAVLTVTRNTPATQSLTITLSSDHDDDLSYEKSVIIPAGSASVDIPVSVLTNGATEGDRTVVFTATADGFTKGVCWMMITDQTLPDAVISSIILSETELEAGGKADLTLIVKNTGAAALAENTAINLYLSNSTNPVATFHTQQLVAVGESETIVRNISLPDVTGNHMLFAVVNESKSVKELTYLNNRSAEVPVRLLPKFTTIVSVDKAIYKQGESVLITGQLTGNAIANANVELYIIHSEIRQTLQTVTNASGHFQLNFQPSIYQSGHFIAGACYPGEGLTIEQTAFDIYGAKRADSRYITLDVTVDEPFLGNIALINTGVLALNNVRAEIVSGPESGTIVFDPISRIEGNETQALPYTLTGNVPSEGENWQQFKIRILSDESDLLELTIYAYFRLAQGHLKTDISAVRTTMTKGAIRDYPFTITNIGKGESGKISLSLPSGLSWLTTATPREMASLKPNESTTVILRFTPGDDLPLNVPVTGTIGVNCESGTGFPLAFSVEPVSESTGTLVVDVCDEYTYYTEEAPHVAGAKVLLKHPVSGVVIAEGLTNEAGLFSVDNLPEGYYALEVSAEKHDRYQNNILVDPGKETRKVVNLSFQAITIDWKVEETTVEDEYEITVKVDYETNVPAPVVEVTFPKELEYKAQLFNIIVTNVGLIRATKVELELPQIQGVNFEILSEHPIDTLLPQASAVIPVKMTVAENFYWGFEVNGDGSASPPSIPCIEFRFAVVWHWECGADLRWYRIYKAYRYGGPCTENRPIYGGGGGGPTGPGSGGGGSYSGGGGINRPYIATDCNEDLKCLKEMINTGVDCLFDLFLPDILDCSKGLYDCYTDFNVKNVKSWIDCTMTILSCAGEEIPIVGTLWTLYGCFTNFCDIIEKCQKYNYPAFLPAMCSLIPDWLRRSNADLKPVPTIVENFLYANYNMERAYFAYLSNLEEIYGNDCWYNVNKTEWNNFYSYIQGHQDADGHIEVDENVYNYKPSNSTEIEVNRLIERWNNTVSIDKGETIQGNNYINLSKLEENFNILKEVDNIAKSLNYNSVFEMFEMEMAKIRKYLDEPMNSVCASISLQFSQTMTLTRQAFRGTLTVFNGHEETAMQDVKLNLVVKDNLGNIATSHEFQINNETLNKFVGELNGFWSLGAQETGIATIVFIPTKYAAPTDPVDYSFGGTLSYIDPFTGLEVTRDLYPVTLTVKPSPNLDLTYFMQRDVLGDDPLTPEVEPKIPSEFSLLIHNVGAGEATNLRMVTQQPKIIDNQKGLLIDFELLSSQLNGGEQNLALGGSIPTDFGTIEPGQTTYAQWWFTASLLGHFTEYNVAATHITSYGNPDLTLLNEVSIHELIRSIRIPDDGNAFLTGFLVNDLPDANDLPDQLYLSNGVIESVAHTTNIQCAPLGDNRYRLTVAPTASGWNYGALNDPVNGLQQLIEVKRESDNALIDLHNFWQTDRTLRDDRDPLYENKLHLIDKLGTGNEQYILSFSPRPDVFLKVDHFEGIPEAITTTPVSEVTVYFNKNIDASSFTADDIHLTCQGAIINSQQIVITPLNEKTFKLDVSNVTQSDGYYVLTIQTAEITDFEGYSGNAGKTAGWNQYIGGKIQFNLKIEPETGGTVTPATGKYDFGSELHLQAIPNEGYLFDSWSINGEIYSKEPAYNFTLLSSRTLTATFKLKMYSVDVATNDGNSGRIIGGGAGIYGHGDRLILQAEASSGYVFKYWIINGESGSAYPVLDITVASALTIEAFFAPECEDVEVDLGGDRIVENYASLELDAGEGYASYLWSTGATDSKITLENTGKVDKITVWVAVSTTDNCVGKDTIQVFYSPPNDLVYPKDEPVEIFPVPAKNLLNIWFSHPEQREISLYDLQGNLIYRNIHSEEKITLKLQSLHDGIYLLKINKRREIKIIVSH